MKRLFYILSFVLVTVLSACGEYDQPYVGYIIVDRAVLDATANSSTTVLADTDIPSDISVASNSGSDWCEVSINGKEITLTATVANTDSNYRTANIVLSCGYRQTTLTVLQKFNGQEFLQYDWTRWTATGNGVQANDGGGYSSLFTEDRGKFWHSAYSPASVALPYILDIDMQEELECAMFHIGRRHNSGNGNNYGTVKTMNIYASTDKENYEKVGGYSSLFTEDRGKFWHSAYSPASVALPYILDIDMQEELECAMFHIGRRHNSGNGNNYGTVKTMNIYASTDKENYEKVGGFTFALPWTAPDGTVVDKATNPLIPAYEEIKLASPVKARYIRLEITETNMSNNACQVAYFKAFEKI